MGLQPVEGDDGGVVSSVGLRLSLGSGDFEDGERRLSRVAEFDVEVAFVVEEPAGHLVLSVVEELLHRAGGGPNWCLLCHLWIRI